MRDGAGATDGEDAADARLRLRRRLLAERGYGRKDVADGPRRYPRLGTGAAALSSAQRRMWFAQRREPDSAAYNVCVGFRIRGVLDPKRLRRAFGTVADRQDVLRTVYRIGADGTPEQVVLTAVDIPWETAVVRGAQGEEAESEANAMASRFGREPFDLEHDAPLRLLLITLGPRHHLLVMVLHHIAVDDLSWEPLLSGVAAHYRAAETDGGGREPRARYAEFAEWEQTASRSDLYADSLSHWRKRLAPWPDAVTLPVGFPGTDPTPGLGTRRRVLLPKSTEIALKELGKDAGASLFMTGLTCLTALLSRYSGQSDVAVGTVVANRPHPEVEQLIGNFGNTLVLRIDAAGGPRFTELLSKVQKVCLDAFEHQEVPFDRVVEAVGPPRRQDGTGLFNVMFSQRGPTLPDVDFPEQEWSEHPVFNGTTRFDLAVEVVSAPDGLALTATGPDQVFAPEDLDRFLGHLSILIGGVLADPSCPINRLPLMTGSELSAAIDEWNATDRTEYLPTTTLPGLIAEQVRRRPKADAIIHGDTRMSYTELDARANRLAHQLMAARIGPKDLVGVLLERSPDQIVALMAVLKTGAAFVPLDPAWPQLRITEILSGAGLAGLITTADTFPRGEGETVPSAEVPLVVDLHADADVIAGRSADPVAVPVPLDALAYVIYTSGSTGTPKGVMIPHRAIVNRLPWQADLLGLTDSDAVLHKAPISFDISINEIFLPLAAGCRLVLADSGGESDVGYLLSLIARQRVTFVYLVSSMLDLMVERHDSAEAFGALRHVWCGGEVLSPELYLRFRGKSGARMYHGYGPAEATIGVTCQVYENTDQVRNVTIGTPNPNTQVYLLDADRQPVPVGVAGELHIGGLPLAHGYLNEPELTAERFVRHPFRGGDERLYRTGDLARYRPDGHIEFVGRVDNQVKISGRRIELEEIESKLSSHPAVRQAVVLVREDRGLGDSLVGYVATGNAEEDRTRFAYELGDWLAERLPRYMVPRAVLALPELPLKSSGKVDKVALAAIDMPPPDRPALAYVPPDGALQESVADIWAQVLKVDRVGVHDNFFDLGGHSLLVIRVQTRIHRELGHDVPVVTLFEKPTVSEIAAHLQWPVARSEDEEAAELAAIQGRGQRRRRAQAARRHAVIDAEETS